MKISFLKTVRRAVVGAAYWVQESELRPHRVRELFTVRKKVMDFHSKRWGFEEIPNYYISEDRPGWIGLPLYAGLEMFPAEEIIEDLSDGRQFSSWTKLPDPNHPMAAPGQAAFMKELTLSVDEFYTTLVEADTGTGKTVVSLGEAASKGRSTLVLVPLERLMLQWKRQAHELLGLPKDCIGIVQGDKCQWDREIVIGMMHSVSRRVYTPEFYSAFGTLIVDEVHNTGAQMLSQCLGLFNARNKLALSATIDETGESGGDVYLQHFGPPAVRAVMEGVPTEVISVVPKRQPVGVGSTKEAALKALANHKPYYDLVAEVAAEWHAQGQVSLLMVEHIDHAQKLVKFLKTAGIPENDIGLYLGQQVAYGGREKTSKEYLDWVERVPPVIIATYGMMEEGIDVPRITRGMDVDPRRGMVQALGRIRRRYPGKEVARWVTFRVRSVPSLERSYLERMKDIRGLNNVTVKQVGEDELFNLL